MYVSTFFSLNNLLCDLQCSISNNWLILVALLWHLQSRWPQEFNNNNNTTPLDLGIANLWVSCVCCYCRFASALRAKVEKQKWICIYLCKSAVWSIVIVLKQSFVDLYYMQRNKREFNDVTYICWNSRTYVDMYTETYGSLHMKTKFDRKMKCYTKV